MEEKIKELYANTDFVEKLKKAESLNEIADLFCNEGIDVSADDLSNAQALLNENSDELSEEILETVSGGSVFWGCVIIWCGVSFGIGCLHGFIKGGR